jgi:hypothetical protein
MMVERRLRNVGFFRTNAMAAKEDLIAFKSHASFTFNVITRSSVSYLKYILLRLAYSHQILLALQVQH